MFAAKWNSKLRFAHKQIRSLGGLGNDFALSGGAHDEGRLKLGTFVYHNRLCFGVLIRAGEQSAARAHNSAFFRGYFRHGGAELRRVVKPYGGDYLQNRLRHGVCGVQTAAYARFKHHDVTFLLRKPEQCRRSGDLKGVEHGSLLTQGVSVLTHSTHNFRKALSTYHFAVYHHPLAEFEHEGRNIAPGFITRSAQNGSEHGNGGAFSVCTGNIYCFYVVFRVSQSGKKRLYSVKGRIFFEAGIFGDVLYAFFKIQKRTSL